MKCNCRIFQIVRFGGCQKVCHHPVASILVTPLLAILCYEGIVSIVSLAEMKTMELANTGLVYDIVPQDGSIHI